ncbi:tetratricopeptide repeat protein, partial [Alphaproteobacteria bacterium]|nr:tetratricopeptide repeat protein [Alphaproteobacteria bacterium]
MSINIRFQKANKFFIENNYLKGLEILKNVWIQYPKNTRLIDEINRHSKKFKKSIIPTFSDKEIEFFFNMHRDGKINSVIEKLVQIYKKKPDDILLISLLGTFYGLNKDYDRAIFFQKIAIEKAPFEPAFHRNLSETFKKVDKIKDALSFLYFAKILSLNDKSIDYEIAKLNTDLKNYLAADLIYKRLMTEENINNEIKYSYCSNLIKLNKVNEAILFLEKIQINDDKNDILTSLLGVAYFQLKNFELAKKNFLKAINLNKNNDNAYTNLGNCYFELGLIKQAEDSHNNSLKINPNNKMALNNLAALYFFKGDINNAEKFYTLSINSNQKNYEAKYSLAQCQLAKLNYKEGWSNFDFRWLSHYFNSPIFQTNWPKFKIKSERKNVLLWQEQGIGDQILFIRFLKDLIPIINNLYIEIDKRLHPIIKRLYPNINFYNKALSIDETNINSQLPLGDLGSFFVQDDSYFLKNNKSYITSDIKKNEELQSKLNSKNKIKCGISWISKNKDIGLNKSLTLEMLKP